MAKYRVKEKAFINGRLVKPGQEVELDLPKEHSIPDHLEPAESNPTKAGRPAKAPSKRPAKGPSGPFLI